MFVSRENEQELNVKETKPPIVNQQCVVYGFQCDLCDAGYVGYKRLACTKKGRHTLVIALMGLRGTYILW